MKKISPCIAPWGCFLEVYILMAFAELNLALTRLHARVFLIDYICAATTADNAVVAVTCFQCF